jgi:hypothetical protein
VDDTELLFAYSSPVSAPQKIAVQMFIQEMAMTYHVIFMKRGGKHRIGRIYTYNSPEQVFAILRRAHANLETINIVEMSFAQHRTCSVDLSLTAEQFSRLNRES